jgi:hypothetical protein
VRMDRRRTEKAHKAWIRRKGLMIDWIGVVLGCWGLVWGWTWDRVVRYNNCQPNPANHLKSVTDQGGLAVVLLLLDSKWTPCFVLLDSCSGCRKLSIPQALYCSWSRGSAELRCVKFCVLRIRKGRQRSVSEDERRRKEEASLRGG